MYRQKAVSGLKTLGQSCYIRAIAHSTSRSVFVSKAATHLRCKGSMVRVNCET